MPPLLSIALSVILFHLIGHNFSVNDASSMPGPNRRTKAAPAGSSPSEKAPGKQNGLLAIDDLKIGFNGHRSSETGVVRGLDLALSSGEKVAVIGASGSGKSLLLLAVLGLLPASADVEGRIRYKGMDIGEMDAMQWRRYRGVSVGYVPQGIGHALNPVVTIGQQIAERIYCHCGTPRRTALREAGQRLAELHFDNPGRVLGSYPHHLSGGMKQRVLIAMAMAGRPRLLLADEPTKGLDGTAAAKVTGCFRSLIREAVLAVTHDLLFAQALDGRVLVMLKGLVVEHSPAALFFDGPAHPYACALLEAHRVPAMDAPPVEQGDAIWREGEGCGFRRQCPQARAECRNDPPWIELNGRGVRCWRYAG